MRLASSKAIRPDCPAKCRNPYLRDKRGFCKVALGLKAGANRPTAIQALLDVVQLGVSRLKQGLRKSARTEQPAATFAILEN